MKRLNGRRMILWIMTLVLCVTTCMPAFASVGDRTLIHSNRDTSEVSIRGIYPLGEGFCIGHSYFCNLREPTEAALRRTT